MRFLIILFLLAVAVLIAVVLTQPQAQLLKPAALAIEAVKNSASHYVREVEVAQAKARIASLSFEEIAHIGAAARLAADGDEMAQAWLDAQLAKVSK